MSSNKIVFLEKLRAAAAVSVVFIHTLNSELIYYSQSPSAAAGMVLLSEICKHCLYWGVPCFLMITGYLLFPPEKELTYGKIFKSYIPRMLGVLIVFAVPFSWLELVFDEHRIHPMQLLRAATNVAEGNTWAHLWYVYAMIGIYALLPCMKMIVRQADETDRKYILLLLLTLVCVSPVLKAFSYDLPETFKLILSTHHYPLWLFLGYLFRLEGDRQHGPRDTVGLILSTVLLAVCTVIARVYGLDRMNVLFSYSSMLVLIQTISIFSLVKRRASDSGSVGPVVRIIAGNSFGIYIVHMFFVNLSYKLLKIDPYAWGYGGLLLYPMLGTVILGLSLLTTILIKKLPVVRRIL